MAEYIERGRLQTAIQKGCKPWGYDYYRYVMGWSDCLTRVRDMVRKAPAADVAPVVHGRWDIMGKTKTRRICSKCRWDVPEYGKFYSYCPNCGAKMDGGED